MSNDWRLMPREWQSDLTSSTLEAYLVDNGGIVVAGVCVTSSIRDIIAHLEQLADKSDRLKAQAKRKASLPDKPGWWWYRSRGRIGWRPRLIVASGPNGDLRVDSSHSSFSLSDFTGEWGGEWGGFIGEGPDA